MGHKNNSPQPGLFVLNMRGNKDQTIFKQKELILKDSSFVHILCSIRPSFFSKFDDFFLTNIQIPPNHQDTNAILSFSSSEGKIINVTLERLFDYTKILFSIEFESNDINDKFYEDKLDRFHEIFIEKINRLKKACDDCIYKYEYTLKGSCEHHFIQNDKTKKID